MIELRVELLLNGLGVGINISLLVAPKVFISVAAFTCPKSESTSTDVRSSLNSAAHFWPVGNEGTDSLLTIADFGGDFC